MDRQVDALMSLYLIPQYPYQIVPCSMMVMLRAMERIRFDLDYLWYAIHPIRVSATVCRPAEAQLEEC